MALKLVLFDLDGTLVDTLPDIAEALAVALAPTGVAPPSLALVQQMVGDGTRALVQRALAGGPADAAREEATMTRLVDSYRANVCVASRLYAGVAEGLTALHEAGVALAVVTNKLGDLARTLLGKLGIAGRFTAIVGDGDGYPRKPDPAAARAIMANAGASIDETMVVGDGIPDVRLAHALGVAAIAATWGYVPAEQLAREAPAQLASSFTEALATLL